MMVCLASYYFLRAARWSRILSTSHNATALELTAPLLIGAAGNNLLPAHMGELVRIYYAGTKLQVPKSTVLGTLVVERLFDLMAVLILFAVALLHVNISEKLPWLAGLLMLATLALYFTCWLISKYPNRFLSILTQLTFALPPKVSRAVTYHTGKLADGLSMLRSAKELGLVTLNSFAQWFFMAGCIYSSMLAFDLTAGISAATVVLGVTVIGLLLPTSPGFFGTIEYAFVLGLGLSLIHI